MAANDTAGKSKDLKRKECYILQKSECQNIVTVDCKDSNRCVTSLAGSGPPCTSLGSANETGNVVEELTVENYRTSNLASFSSPNSLWKNDYHLAGGSGLHGLSMPQDKDPLLLRAREQLPKVSSDISILKPLSIKQIDRKAEEISAYLRACDNKITSNSTLAIGDTQLRTLSKSSLPQLFAKRTLKGKGVISRNPENQGEIHSAIQGQNDEKFGYVKNVASDASLKSSANIDQLSMCGPGQFGQPFRDEVNLRELLKPGCCKRNKVESLNLFRQIVELVDFAHSQGVTLVDLRPSCFTLSPSYKIKYTGSFSNREIENVVHPDSKNKRLLEHDVLAYSHLCAKQQKVGENMKNLGLLSQSTPSCGITNETGKKLDFSWNSEQDSRVIKVHYRNHTECQRTPTHLWSMSLPGQVEEKWYTSPEEISGRGHTFASNIYSLGVLLFELLCDFESWEMHSEVMLNLYHRILPPNFLSENSKEAGFCLWLLHPEPSSRPTAREILQSELLCGPEELYSGVGLCKSFDDSEAESDLLLCFLTALLEQKQRHASKLFKDIECVEEDIQEAERSHLLKTCSTFPHSHKEFLNSENQGLHIEHPLSSVDLPRPSSVSNMNEARLMRNISQLEAAYFSMRSKMHLTEAVVAVRSDRDLLKSRDCWSEVQNKEPSMNEKSNNPPGAFYDGLCKFARYSKFEVCGVLRNGDLLNSANVICSLSFDRDEDFIAAAGVSKRVKIFEFSALLNDTLDIHYPVVELSNKSKLSCVCWNNYIKNYLASTDYDGVVKIWDARTGQGFSQYVEHQKRAWSVDFSQADPTKFASGSDDCSAKLWDLKEKNSIGSIWNPANICCVQFSPFSTHLLAFGSADYKVYCYDLRHTRIPWCTLAGHEKAVSYVKFLDSENLVSASTDNTLRQWDLNQTSSDGLSSVACSLSFTGHTNEKNFVGLSVFDGYIACGSETNEVYGYHRSLPMPITSHKFGSVDPISGAELGDDNGQFVSSVCWRQTSNMVVAANSNGRMKILQLV